MGRLLEDTPWWAWPVAVVLASFILFVLVALEAARSVDMKDD
jgi:hypothetical protein